MEFVRAKRKHISANGSLIVLVVSIDFNAVGKPLPTMPKPLHILQFDQESSNGFYVNGIYEIGYELLDLIHILPLFQI